MPPSQPPTGWPADIVADRDASLAAYLGHLHEAGRAPATAAMVVATVKRSARDASTAVPIGPLTRRALEGFRRTDAAAAPPRPAAARARGLTADECATVLATCLRLRRTGRGLERPKTAERRSLVDGAIRRPAVPRRPPSQRGRRPSVGPTSISATATTS